MADRMLRDGSLRYLVRGGAVLTLLVFLGGVFACRVPLTAPSGSALTLLASENLVPVNGSAQITAVVIEGALGATTGTATTSDVVAGIGTPVHDGTVVTFSTTLGRLEPAEVTTKNGRATVTLYGDGRSGTAKITAFSGGAMNTLEIDIGAAGATRIAVTASPQALPAGGGASTISARVEDQQGNGVSGISITFTTTRGTLTTPTVVTDSQGFARTTLTTTGESTVTASSGGSATSLVGTVQLTVS